MKKRAHVAYNSGKSEWYTPPEYIEAAKQVMEDIDVDPASCRIANKTVGAKTYYTKTEDGLTKRWPGRVWLNPPYSQPDIAKFCEALMEKYRAGETSEAITMVNNATETKWFQMILTEARAVCLIQSRVKFLDRLGNRTGTPLQGQAIVYFGPNVSEFGRVFSKFGCILWASNSIETEEVAEIKEYEID